MKTIQIKIKSNGEIEAETKGMKGKSCLKYIAEIEKMTDAVAVDSDFTDEYFENNMLTAEETLRENI